MPKPGHVSASRIKDMMTMNRAKSGFGQTAIDYARDLALERLGIEVPDNSGGYATDWGNEHEWLAIQVYEINKFVEVHGQQEWIEHPKFEWVGGTPDGLIGVDGGLDVKCPYQIKNHMKNILDNEQLKQYNFQFQSYMWISGRKWWDFVSFDPRYPKALQLHVHRVPRCENTIQLIENRYNDFESVIQGFVDTLVEKIGKSDVVTL
jgi:predicted phage-related endonuclease